MIRTVKQSSPALSKPIYEYNDLISAIVSRRKALGMSQLALEHRAGLAEGHISKIEYGGKRLGPISLPCILKSLGVSIVILPDDQAHALTAIINENSHHG